jgi:hypothetical protein
VHSIETVAAILEVIACVGWTWSWNATYTRVPGRGWTFDDPDVWALITIYIGGWIYLVCLHGRHVTSHYVGEADMPHTLRCLVQVYNIQNVLEPGSYEANRLYVTGDVVYFGECPLGPHMLET